MTTETNNLMDEIRKIKIDIEFIKTHMIDADIILTQEQITMLDESLKNEKDGN
jgi:hypothetical protein